MTYLTFLLAIVVLFLGFIGWTLDGIRDSLKSIDSKLDSLDDHAHNVEENSELLIKLKTRQARFNRETETFEDV